MRRAAVPLLVAALTATVASCSRGSVNDAGAYCADLEQERAVITEPIRSSTDIDAVLATYQELHDEAPLAVQDQWEQVIELVRAASTVDLEDQTALSDLTDQAYSTAAAAQAIADHAAQVCGLDLPRPGALPTPATTIAVPPTT